MADSCERDEREREIWKHLDRTLNPDDGVELHSWLRTSTDDMRWLLDRLDEARAQLAEARKEIAVDEALLDERDRLLALFDCPAHGGGCVPHAIEDVQKARAQLAEKDAELTMVLVEKDATIFAIEEKLFAAQTEAVDATRRAEAAEARVKEAIASDRRDMEHLRDELEQRESVIAALRAERQAVFSALGVDRIEHALEAVQGLRNRLRFTESFETLQYELERVRAAASPAHWMPLPDPPKEQS